MSADMKIGTVINPPDEVWVKLAASIGDDYAAEVRRREAEELADYEAELEALQASSGSLDGESAEDIARAVAFSDFLSWAPDWKIVNHREHFAEFVEWRKGYVLDDSGHLATDEFGGLVKRPLPDKRAEEVAKMADHFYIQELARDEARNRRNAETMKPIPESLGGADFLRIEFEGPRWLIDDVWSADGKVGLLAQRKAGKTTIVGNAIRSLTDGTPFLDRFASAGGKRVFLLDLEMPERELQRVLLGQGIECPELLTVTSLMGRSSAFNILDDKRRAEWARRIQDTGSDVLILDCLAPLVRALKLDEWRDLGTLAQATDELCIEAGVAQKMLVHHMGHVAEGGRGHARGDSSFEGWPDSLWRLRMDDENDIGGFHYFQALGRGVDVAEGLVSKYDGERLAYASVTNEVTLGAVGDRLHAAMVGKGELKKEEVLGLRVGGVTEKKFASIMETLIDAGRVTMRTGAKNAKFYQAA